MIGEEIKETSNYTCHKLPWVAPWYRRLREFSVLLSLFFCFLFFSCFFLASPSDKNMRKQSAELYGRDISRKTKRSRAVSLFIPRRSLVACPLYFHCLLATMYWANIVCAFALSNVMYMYANIRKYVCIIISCMVYCICIYVHVGLVLEYILFSCVLAQEVASTLF